jgi:tetratricopeptide (TPR) repeat protein
LTKINELCANYFSEAESYFYEKRYEEAEPLYEKMLELSCSNNRQANLRLLELRKAMADRRHRAQVILYEFEESAPIGLSYGRYSTLNFGTYLSLRFNPELFKAFSKTEDLAEKPEVNLSFGFTRMAIKEVGFFAGLGYTGVGKWDKSENSDEDAKVEFYHAVSPEAGLLFKLGPIALRYTFQYRYSLDNDKVKKDHIGAMKHVVGIGICF